jgi:hypothetical protein
MVMAIIHQDFKKFLKLLNSHGVEYLLVEKYAVGYYGYPRATADKNIWVSTTNENIDKNSPELIDRQNKITKND